MPGASATRLSLKPDFVAVEVGEEGGMGRLDGDQIDVQPASSGVEIGAGDSRGLASWECVRGGVPSDCA